MRTEYKYIDILKFIFAIFVVCLHVPLKGTYIENWISPIFFRLAVPYFFVASGFFIGIKIITNKDGVKWKSIFKRYAEKLLVFEPVSIAIQVAIMIFTATAISTIITSVCKSIIFYPWGALWYIQALIVGLALLIPFIKRDKLWLALIISIILYGFALLCNRYYFLTTGTWLEPIVQNYLKIFVSARNGVFVGMMYMAMGMLIARYADRLNRYKSYLSGLMVISFIVFIFEVSLLQDKIGADDNALFITHILLIPLLFIVSTQHHCKKLGNTLILRNLSTSIYLIHSPINYTIKAICEIFKITINPYIHLLIIIGIVLLISYPIYRNKTQPLYRWLT